MEIKIFEGLLNEKIENFKSIYSANSKELYFNRDGKTIYTNQNGDAREVAFKDLLRVMVPTEFDIGKGFVITGNEHISHQCDVVVYNSKLTPLYESNEKQRFFPVETIAAVGEVRSTISEGELKETLNELSYVKKLREEASENKIVYRVDNGSYDPLFYAYDQLITFIICEKLDFNIEHFVYEINKMYDKNIENRHKHNLILSIKNGVLLYFDNFGRSSIYPILNNNTHKNRIIIPSNNTYCHFKYFANYLYNGITKITMLKHEMRDYMFSSLGGTYIDER